MHAEELGLVSDGSTTVRLLQADNKAERMPEDILVVN
jgi:hypothetical protein